MPVITLHALERIVGGSEPLASAVITAEYRDASGPYVQVDSADVIFPTLVSVPISNGEPQTPLSLEPTLGLCYVLLRITSGPRSWAREVAIPDVVTIDIGALSPVSPETFEPTDENRSAWEATAAEIYEFGGMLPVAFQIVGSHLHLLTRDEQDIDLGRVTGADGVAPTVEMRTNAGYIQWRVNEGSWTNLVSLSSISGSGVPTGGLTRQLLSKKSATDLDAEWRTLITGGVLAIPGSDRVLWDYDRGITQSVGFAQDGSAILIPHLLLVPVLIKGMAFHTAGTAGSAGAVVRSGLYSPDPLTLLPKTRIVDAGTVDGTVVGLKLPTFATLTVEGLIWEVVAAQGGATTRASMGGGPKLGKAVTLAAQSNASSPSPMLLATGITGALPTEWSATLSLSGMGNAPSIGLVQA